MHNIQKAIIIFIVLSCNAEASAGVEILVPDTQVSTTKPRIYVVGRTAAAEVIVELNGELIDCVSVRDSIFHKLVLLPFGFNEIKIWAWVPVMEKNEGNTERTVQYSEVLLDVICGPHIPSRYLKVFTPSLFHGTQNYAMCLSCHQAKMVQAAGPFIDPEIDAAWCQDCHPDIKKQFISHTVEEIAVCTSCHFIGADLKDKPQEGYPDINPCFLCHQDKIGEFAQDFIHGPVAGGSCSICHNPHGSEFSNNLRSPEPFLCQFCHTSYEGMEAEVQHQPFKDGKCVTCHDPHATGNRWVLVRSSSELCLDCHQDAAGFFDHRHPYDVEPKRELATSLPLTNNGKLECQTCHNAHGSNAAHMLKSQGQNLCLGCHPDHE